MMFDADQVAVAHQFVAGLAQGGMRRMIVSPGSRSTPLALAVHASKDIDLTMVIDERSAGFIAVGAAQVATGPVGLLCSSGTAGANYLPALSEASMADLALVAITADRPPEHQQWGVGQAFTQTGLFHRQVRLEFEMPTGGSGGLDHAERAGRRAAQVAVQQHGPVHVNWAFRLPLEPTEQSPAVHAELPAAVPKSASAPAEHEVVALVAAIVESASPMIVAGPNVLDRERDRSDQVERLRTALKRIGVPIMTDVLSGLRVAGPPHIEAAQFALAAHDINADLIIRVGDTPTSKAIRLWWESLGRVPHILIDPRSRWQDPSHVHTLRLQSDPDVLFEAVARRLENLTDFSDWREKATSAGRKTQLKLDAALDQAPWSEAHVARTLTRFCPPNAVVVASSSMPIRDIDTFAPTPLAPTIVSNRGINGIDGVLATAVGVALAKPVEPVYVLIGDIACMHDIGSLYQAARLGVELTVVVVNNDGGAIFSMLPIAESIAPDVFETLFTTPHGQTFEFVGGHPGIEFVLADESNFLSSLERTPNSEPVRVVELRVDAHHRFELLQQMQDGTDPGSRPR